MRRTAVSLAVCCLALHAASAQRPNRPAADTGTTPELLTLYRRMMTAIDHGDTAALARLWARTYVFTGNSPDSTSTLTRAERLRVVAEMRRDTTGGVLDSSRVEGCTFRTYGAFAAGPCRVTQHYHEGTERVTLHTVATVLFTREGGRWRVLATHTASFPESK